MAAASELWLQMMENLDWPNAVKEIVQAEKFLRSEGSPKVASIGFCMGTILLPFLLLTCQTSVYNSVGNHRSWLPKQGLISIWSINMRCLIIFKDPLF